MKLSLAPLTTLLQARGVAELFHQVYGEGYPVGLYYRPELLLEANQRGETLSEVACDQTGRVVGHCALYRSAPNPRLLEMGAGLVHSDTRGLGAIASLVRGLVDRARGERLADWLFAEAVCNHTTTQRTVHREGFADTALEIDLMPASAYTQEASAVGRVSTLLSFLRIDDAEAQVYLPTAYRSELQALYGVLGASRTVLEAPDGEVPEAGGGCQRWHNEAANLLRITVTSVGTDLESWLTEKGEIVQLSLPLDSPHLGWAVEKARVAGFVLSGLLPGWAGVDHLLLQRFAGPTEWDRVALESESARAMLARVQAELFGQVS